MSDPAPRRPGPPSTAAPPDAPAVRAFRGHAETRHDRQQRIEWWDQERLRRARIIVAGAGALGNETLKLLALLGVGSILVVDFDVVSPSNLARTVLFRPDDVGAPKAALAAARARAIDPTLRIAAIDGDVGRDLGLGALRRADLVLAGLDSVNARWALNRRCRLAGVPWLDAGIAAVEGQVTRYAPDAGACYECTFTPGMARRFNARHSCTGLVRRVPERAVPTTAVGASLAAALQAHEALCLLHDRPEGLRPGQRLTYLLDAHRAFVDDLPADPECAAHVPPAVPARTLPDDPRALTPAGLATVVLPDRVASVHLGFDLVEGFACPACCAFEPVCRPATLVFETDARCPRCSIEREVRRTPRAGPESPAWERPLADLGVADREILWVADETGDGLWAEIGGPDPWAAAEGEIG